MHEKILGKNYQIQQPTLDPGLRKLFVRCFIDGHLQPNLRPSPKEWTNTLDQAQKRLVRCAAGTHWRYPEGGACHACQKQQPRPGAPPQIPITPPSWVVPSPASPPWTRLWQWVRWHPRWSGSTRHYRKLPVTRCNRLIYGGRE